MVGLGQRFVGNLLNWIINFMLIGAIINLVFIISGGQTVGGKVMGYKYNDSGIGFALKLWGALIVWGILAVVTIGILPIISLIQFNANGGWMWEKWFGISKVNA